MKKKVLFMIINMNIGGTEKSLLNRIAEMPKEKYEITVLMLEKKGAFLKYIPSHVHIDYLDDYPSIKPLIDNPPLHVIKQFIIKKQLLKAYNFLKLYVRSKFEKNNSLIIKYLLKDIKNYRDKYDQAIAYAGPMDLISYFILNRVRAIEKIQWIHFDVTKIGFNKANAENLYMNFDKVHVVSKEGKSKLLELLPSLEGKVYAKPNQISNTMIEQMAVKGGGFNDNYSGIRLLTVGRLSYEKGHDLIIKVATELKQKGLSFKWYCIGEGKERERYEKLIKESELQNDLILLGSTSNPYPYMKECDLYVQPSRHEGYCLTLAEAKVFNKPIVSTNFTGAYEQLSNRKEARIVNFDEHDMSENIITLLKIIERKEGVS